jgi:hypothetical protein
MLTAIRRTSSFVSTLACFASVPFAEQMIHEGHKAEHRADSDRPFKHFPQVITHPVWNRARDAIDMTDGTSTSAQ